MTGAYVGLGSNLGDREQAIRQAAERIGAVRLSEIRETEPWGYVDQPDFLNAVAEVETALGPRELLDFLLGVEHDLGRERGAGPRYGPRTIDLDLLLYDEEAIDEPGLTVPHPRLHERRFMLEPLVELDPALVVPGRGTVAELLAALH
jgi:2-amino-4-hydroxy-6-hydroxymethyldihydropteridine diphosphokinase